VVFNYPLIVSLIESVAENVSSLIGGFSLKKFEQNVSNERKNSSTFQAKSHKRES
jgi:hypothetical protein